MDENQDYDNVEHVDDEQLNDNVVEDVNDVAEPSHLSRLQQFTNMLEFQRQQIMHAYTVLQSNTPMRRVPYRQTTYTRADWINELLSGHDRRFYDAMGMNKKVFKFLCQEIKQTGCHGDERQQKVRIQESVAVFLHTIKGHQRHRRAAESFNRSTKTISNYVHIMVTALCKLAPKYIRPPDFNRVPDWIRKNRYLYPYFKDCIGAIDGTIIPAWIPEQDHGKYRCRKGSANDARIFAETLTDPTNTFPWPPEGKYYVVDSGYANIPGFLSPYRGDRYHLPEWIRSNQTPQNARELFNRRHATVRNVVERSFGILKGKFPIIKGLMPNYPPEFQTDIVIACCVAHNFILEHQKFANVPLAMQDPDYIPEPDEYDFTRTLRTTLDTSNVGLREQTGLRDTIADALWRDHAGRHH
ncbi:Unknown protein [Striga hermonthica]|uniref:DDE Tnp4 domain-containing protein n=1 Tax=Striga hermonthica TaxID=68872 RepID=A0A9N7NYJ7_STRHE|nr:Unknown protein [Striga hermonthica]